MTEPDGDLLSLNTATVRAQWKLPDIIAGCARHGIRGISPWRDKIAELGLATHEPYHGVALTDQGRRVALEVLRHHRLLELLLADLGLPWDRVHDEAEVLEHHISEELEALIAARLGA